MRALILVALLAGCSGESVPNCGQCGNAFTPTGTWCSKCYTPRQEYAPRNPARKNGTWIVIGPSGPLE